MVYVITYFMIGLALVIGYSIYGLKQKGDWEEYWKLSNEVEEECDWPHHTFSASEAERNFMYGLLILLIAWPVDVIIYFVLLYRYAVKNIKRK